MNIIDLVSNEGDSRLLAWKFPNRQLAACAQLLVGQGETAVLFTDRGSPRLYPVGRYTLETANLPLLRALVKLPFGGRPPFEAEVWFLPTGELPDIRWGIGGTGKQVLRGYGQLSIRVADPVLFLTSLCRNLSSFSGRQLTERLHAPLMQAVRGCAAAYACHNSLEGLSQAVCCQLEPVFVRYGLELTAFYTAELSVPDLKTMEPPTVQPAAAAVKPQPSVRFCTECGAKQQPDWHCCPYCGNKHRGGDSE